MLVTRLCTGGRLGLINNRMVIGTFPYEQLRAIFQALVDEAAGDSRFMENWEE